MSKNLWQNKDFVEDSLTSLLRNLCTIQTRRDSWKAGGSRIFYYSEQRKLKKVAEFIGCATGYVVPPNKGIVGD